MAAEGLQCVTRYGTGWLKREGEEVKHAALHMQHKLQNDANQRFCLDL